MAEVLHTSFLDAISVLPSIRRCCGIHIDRLFAWGGFSEGGTVTRSSEECSSSWHCHSKTVQKKHTDDVPIVNSGAEHSAQGVSDLRNEPVAIRNLLARWPVVLSVANYATLALLDISYRAVQPLFLSTPIELHGLGVSPATIGLVLGAFGIANGLFQLAFFAKIVERWGAKTLFLYGMTAFIPLFALYPIINLVARHYGIGTRVWSLICLQLCIQVLMDMSFGLSSLVYARG